MMKVQFDLYHLEDIQLFSQFSIQLATLRAERGKRDEADFNAAQVAPFVAVPGCLSAASRGAPGSDGLTIIQGTFPKDVIPEPAPVQAEPEMSEQDARRALHAIIGKDDEKHKTIAAYMKACGFENLTTMTGAERHRWVTNVKGTHK